MTAAPRSNRWSGSCRTVEQQLVDDATSRGWDREVERHTATRDRIQALFAQLGSGGIDRAELSEKP